MSTETMASILIAAMGTVFTIMVAVIGWFWVKNNGAIETQMAKHNEAILKLGDTIRDLAFAVGQIRGEMGLKIEGFDRRIDEHHEEIEMLRDSRHKMFNWLTSIRILGQIHNGWVFKDDWGLPGVVTHSDHQ